MRPPTIELRAALAGNDHRARHTALAELADDPARARELASEISPWTSDGPDDVRSLACAVLGQLDGGVVPALSRALITGTSARVAIAAASAVMRIGPPAALAAPALANRLGDADADVRTLCAAALARIGPSSVSALAPVLRTGTAGAKVAAAEAAGGIGPPAAPLLPDLKLLASSADMPAAIAGATAAARVSGQPSAALPTIQPGLRGSDPAVRRAALQAAGNLRSDARPLSSDVATCLSDRDAEVRELAALTLGRIGAEAGVASPALARALTDVQASVRLMACASLSALQDAARQSRDPLAAASVDPNPLVAAAARSVLEKLAAA